jgi:hemerythrin superfamily protein
MASKSDPSAETNAYALLKADHAKVKALFKQFDKIKEEDAGDEKAELVAQICNELTIHTMIEEEIFYPAVRAAVDSQDVMDEAEVEHAGAKDLIEQLEAAEPDDDLYDAKVTVLGEQVSHHIKEEEDKMFPEAKKAKVDAAALGEQLSARKSELMAEMGVGSDDESAEGIAPAARPKSATRRAAQTRR